MNDLARMILSLLATLLFLTLVWPLGLLRGAISDPMILKKNDAIRSYRRAVK